MQRLSSTLHGTMGSYPRDALQEGSVDAIACLFVPRAYVFSSSLLFAWWPQVFSSSPFLLGGLHCFFLLENFELADNLHKADIPGYLY
jgi:hypothetical protein